MKKFLGFLGDLLVILLELAICAFVVFWLVSHPIIKSETAYSVVTRSLGSSDSSTLLTSSTRSIPSLPVKAVLDIPPVIWIPEHFAPEKQWGYDRVYSCTRLERIPGFWHIPGSQPPTFPYVPMYIFDECALPCF